jgi:chromosome segregation ATPase
MDGELKSFDKKLEKLPIPDTNKAFADLKKELKDLGVEGIEDAKSIDEVKKAIEKLNGKALQRVDDNIAKMEKELEQLGMQGQKAKNGIDQATQAIKEQEEAVR